VLFHCFAEELVALLTDKELKVAFDSRTSSKDGVEPASVQTTVTSSPTSATKTAAAALAPSGGKKRPIGIKPFGPASLALKYFESVLAARPPAKARAIPAASAAGTS
jgi:hypothetical protein